MAVKGGDQGYTYSLLSEDVEPILWHVSVVEVDESREEGKYKVHFRGFKASDDEWVEEVLPYNDENKLLCRELRQVAQLKLKEIKKERAAQRRLAGGPPQSKRARRGDWSDDEGSGGDAATDLKFHFSTSLKRHLFDDFENVTVKKMLVRVPHKGGQTVEKVFNDFLQSVEEPFGLASSAGRLSIETVEQITNGLQVLFDRALGPFLLYAFERLQFEAVREKYPEDEMDHLIIPKDFNSKRRRLSELYGTEHLLRLLVKLPDLVVVPELLSHELKTLRLVIGTLIRFIDKNRATYLQSTAFVPASEDYLKVVQDMP